MSVIAIPNVSEGNDADVIEACTQAVGRARASILDVHSDPVHGRSVLTVVGGTQELIDGMKALAVAAVAGIDLTSQAGVHPRLGVLDVCPFVAVGESARAQAVEVARRAAAAIADGAGLPVYLYGDAALREETRELPDLRKGGLEALGRRALSDLPPDHGPDVVDRAAGVVCVGARRVLIAFNVWLRGPAEIAKRVAASVRSSAGGPGGVRALGFDMGHGLSQVSMNLVDPERTGIEEVFEAVADLARVEGIEPIRSEIVGLVPERYLPAPDAKAARLLDPPGRSLESALKESARPDR